jgi:hypothetical protein
MLKSIHDVHLAAYLFARGFKQAKPPEYQDGQIAFIFDDSKGEISEAIPKFFNKDAPVDAQTYSEYLHSVKSQLIMMKRNARIGGGFNE